MLIAWLKFALYSIAIFLSGYISCKYGSLIAKKSRISEGFMGVFFLALATSAPELLTSVIAVKSKIFDLALGNIFGSLLSNLFILILLDLCVSKGGFLRKSKNFKGIFIILILQALIAVSIILRSFAGFDLDIFSFGLENIFIVILYLIFLKGEIRDGQADIVSSKPSNDKGCLKEWAVFIIALIAMAFFAQLTVIQSKIIVERSMLNYVFFGTLFLGVITSLPELVVTVSALMNRSHAMAIGNIIGSNALDIAIIPILEIVSFKVPIFSKMSSSHLYTLVAVEIVTVVLFVLLRFRKLNRAYELMLLLLLVVPLIIIF
ncbi:MAG: hypothetical protein P9X27_01610 [Candidatus Kaelpia aquatica]|nr:hypothetical protein [Candidatus Kaelpia aquatica]